MLVAKVKGTKITSINKNLSTNSILFWKSVNNLYIQSLIY